MILAVYVGRDRPTDADVLRPRDDGQDPPGRLERSRAAGLASHRPAPGRPALRIELEGGETGGVDHDATVALRRIAIAASHAPSDGPASPATHARRQLRDQLTRRGHIPGADTDDDGGRRDATPPADHGWARRDRSARTRAQCDQPAALTLMMNSSSQAPPASAMVRSSGEDLLGGLAHPGPDDRPIAQQTHRKRDHRQQAPRDPVDIGQLERPDAVGEQRTRRPARASTAAAPPVVAAQDATRGAVG